jgi:hypothetical protein
MLGGGAVALAAPAMPLAAFALPPLDGAADTELWRRIGEVEDCLAAYLQADAVSKRLYQEVRRHPEFPDGMPDDPAEWDRWDALLHRIGTPAADERCERLHGRYEAALAAAFALPARTLAGACGKLRLAVTKIRREQSAGFDFDDVDCAFLGGALADLSRLAEGGPA